MAPSYDWQHNDSRGMSAAITAALWRCTNDLSGNLWKPETPSDFMRADLRALLVATMYMVDALSTKAAAPQVATDGTIGLLQIGERTKEEFSSVARAKIVSALLETWRTIVVASTKSNAPVVQSPSQFRTSGGGEAEPLIGKEAGFGWPVAAVAIVGVTIQAAVICYVADKVATVIDNELTRREATRQMVATHGNVLAILNAHRTAEEGAGGELPLTAAEQAAIDALLKSQVQAQKAIKLDVPSLFPDLKPEGKKIVGALENIGLAGIAAIAVVAYLVFSKGR